MEGRQRGCAGGNQREGDVPPTLDARGGEAVGVALTTFQGWRPRSLLTGEVGDSNGNKNNNQLNPKAVAVVMEMATATAGGTAAVAVNGGETATVMADAAPTKKTIN